MYHIYVLHLYTDKLPDLPFTEVPQPTNKTQDNRSTTEVISGRPVAHSSLIPSEVLSESDDDFIYMGTGTGDSADVDTANDVIIIDEEDKQKPAQQQKQEASNKTEEQAATPVQD